MKQELSLIGLIGMIDQLGRSIDKLRISVTEHCQMRCSYCMPENQTFPKQNEYLSYEEIVNLTKDLKEIANIKKIRLTGGEPLLRSHLYLLVQELKQIGFEDIGLTTNGILLEEQLSDLVKAGLTNVNISLDSLNEARFYQMARISPISKSFEKVLKSIDAALSAGLKVKLNTVLTTDNFSEAISLLTFAQEKKIFLRFLELMSLGEANQIHQQQYVSFDELMTVIQNHFGKTRGIQVAKDSTAQHFKTQSGVEFGVIASESKPFCENCSRMRLSAKGKLYGCLMIDQGIDIRNKTRNELSEIFNHAMLMKPAQRIYQATTMMNQIGG